MLHRAAPLADQGRRPGWTRDPRPRRDAGGLAVWADTAAAAGSVRGFVVAAATASISGHGTCCGAQGVRSPGPGAAARPGPVSSSIALSTPRRSPGDRVGRRHEDQRVRVLPVGGLELPVVRLAIQPQQRRHVVVPRGLEEPRRPAEDRGGVARGGQRVAGVVLAVAEGALAVLPGLAPVDGAQAHQKPAGGSSPRRGSRRRPRPASSAARATWSRLSVVVEAGLHARHARAART